MDVALRTGLETRKIVSRLLKQSAYGERTRRGGASNVITAQNCTYVHAKLGVRRILTQPQ